MMLHLHSEPPPPFTYTHDYVHTCMKVEKITLATVDINKEKSQELDMKEG